MPNYQNGKIYQLWSPEGDLVYIGSTTQPLHQRLSGHKRGSIGCSSKRLFETYQDVRIELVENYPCNTKAELNKREGLYIRKTACVNRCVAGRSKQEWYADNKEQLAEQGKQYYEANRESIAERVKQYREANRERIAERQKRYREANRERIAQYHREYHQSRKLAAQQQASQS